VDDKALEARLVELMKTAQVPGMSICVVRDGVQDRGAFGVRNAETKEPIDDDTVFEAASLSKPIVACAVMQLIRAGDLGLDEPLARYIGPLVPDDPASATITARHVLSHTTGLPNWRRDEFPLRTYFSPGTRFSYSGEGFVYLQTAIEHITGQSLDALVAQLVLQPLGMHRSSLVWRDSFDENAASGHSMEGSIVPKFKPDRPNAAYSLHSTASDYCRFVTALMDNTKFAERAGSLWLKPQVSTPLRSTG
jgi:CubicO group peptidase (beta-lactamase class C family)